MLNDYRLKRINDLIEHYKKAFERLFDTSRYLRGEDLDVMRKALRDGLKKDFRDEKRNSRYFHRTFNKAYRVMRKEFAQTEASERIEKLIEEYNLRYEEELEQSEKEVEELEGALELEQESDIDVGNGSEEVREADEDVEDMDFRDVYEDVELYDIDDEDE